jgi:hypothetical protein
MKVAELYLHGMRCLTHIGHELKVDKATISRDFKHIRKLWRETYIEDLDVAKRDELASIAEIERKAWLGGSVLARTLRPWRLPAPAKEGGACQTRSRR